MNSSYLILICLINYVPSSTKLVIKTPGGAILKNCAPYRPQHPGEPVKLCSPSGHTGVSHIEKLCDNTSQGTFQLVRGEWNALAKNQCNWFRNWHLQENPQMSTNKIMYNPHKLYIILTYYIFNPHKIIYKEGVTY